MAKYIRYIIYILPYELETIQNSISYHKQSDMNIENFTKHKKLFHYTTPQGLKSIIENGCLWMNNTKYMNDASENTYYLDVCSKVIQKMQTINVDENSQYLLNELLKRIRLPVKHHSYITCFSNKDDNLSMWRAYGNDGGFSIGFDLMRDEKLVTNHDSSFFDMEYRTSKQKLMLSKSIEHVLHVMYEDKVYVHNNGGREIFKIYVDSLYKSLLKCFLRLKNPHFKDEHETRLIFNKRKEKNELRKFRTKGNLFIPYYEKRASIGNEETKLPIFKITIGPCPNMELVKESLEDFLIANNYLDVIVKPSKIPYRQL